ncbi:hypothetical protein L218DRAFT_826234, partial [Marasmius fiardii PR-910]
MHAGRLFRQTISIYERQAINQCILDAENDLKTYQEKINRLMSAIIVLETSKDNVKEMIAKYRSLLSPIHRMPPEVLAYIFLFC